MEEKDCFGILDKVFPVGEQGLREIVPECFQCPERTLCLKAALSTEEGLEMRAEILDRASAGGLMGRLHRWSQKKELSRLINQEKEKKR
jgi:hypothetical protein